MADNHRRPLKQMKIDFDQQPGTLTIAAYGQGWIRVRDTRIETSCVITPEVIHTDLLPPALADLTSAHFERLCALAPEIILLGTGVCQTFVDNAIVRQLAERGIGLEVMDTGAACRSFNILNAEQRAVIAALFMI